MLIGHNKQWEFLKNKIESNQLSHAYLFSGANEIGKKTVAIEFAKFINCLAIDKKPCGKCANCLTIEKNNFPDLLIVKSINSVSSIKNKKDNLEIDITQIREAQNFLSYKSYYGAYKTVIVDNSERMDVHAQHCFLKTLEEPKGKTLLILVSSKPEILLPTIASRCQVLKFSRPKDLPENSERLKKEQEILKELLPVMNSGLADKFKYVKALDLDAQDIGGILEVMQKYFRNLLLSGVGVETASNQASKKYNLQKIKDILNLIDNISNKLIFTNANPKLALEILLMEL